ncbi:MAG: patatin-like phospholipase family protein [Phycisphaerales bacterium]|nr:patatin-like phospholipase family protein [Phycisphaerales bacterium]
MRILALDGGGIKALVALTMLREIESRTGRRITDLFDMIGGASTGAVLGALLAIRQNDLDTCEALYLSLARNVFYVGSAPPEDESNSQSSAWSRIVNYTNMLKTGAFYRSKPLMRILTALFKQHTSSIDTARSFAIPNFFVSTQVHIVPPRPFIWRNYNYPPDTPSRYQGTSNEEVYAGLRASTAAPTFFDPYVHPDHPEQRHVDGALYANNPAAVALHEARCLFGKDVPIDCLVSIGTGEAEQKPCTEGFGSMLAALARSAISVEKTDEALTDALAESSVRYFRLDPISEHLDFQIDETREEILVLMKQVARQYVSEQAAVFDRIAAELLQGQAKS